jgi:hypothetical protein
MMCLGCGDVLPAYLQSGAKHCCNACRQVAYRRRKAGLEAPWAESATIATSDSDARADAAPRAALGPAGVRFDPRALIA